MWELDYKESWALKNWSFWTVVLEKTPESPLDCKEIQPVHSKGDQPWMFFGRNDTKAETPILWPPHAKSWLIGKDSDAGRDWGQEEKGTAEDEMAGWHHRLDRREFEWTPGVGDGQGALVYCDSWGSKELDTTERLNWTELKPVFYKCTSCTLGLGFILRLLPVLYTLSIHSVHFKNHNIKWSIFRVQIFVLVVYHDSFTWRSVSSGRHYGWFRQSTSPLADFIAV